MHYRELLRREKRPKDGLFIEMLQFLWTKIDGFLWSYYNSKKGVKEK